ncbi:hypothetical protein B0T18DRAFT_395657 [Schizothecium vesticola]|uniref:Secreted protein n=1 Tax=Schizothecium vesticola TaxID=314040 RepID=A0AA40F819_9PEZI|nr:hypothetical protein B0T18DRAFT_395657 [Schizothecium vesticola]
MTTPSPVCALLAVSFFPVFFRLGGERRVSSRSRWCRNGKQRRERVQVETIKRARGCGPCLRPRRPITGPLWSLPHRDPNLTGP